MKNIHTHIRNHVLFYMLFFLVGFVGVVSYFRFIVYQDYLVQYEGVCDPSTDSCFIGFDDNIQIGEYYYSSIIKYAPDLYRECGDNITDCEMANSCSFSDRECVVTFCDPVMDGDVCSSAIKKLNIQENDQTNPVEEDLLIDTNI